MHKLWNLCKYARSCQLILEYISTSGSAIYQNPYLLRKSCHGEYYLVNLNKSTRPDNFDYSKTCVKRPPKKDKTKILNDKW